MKKFSRLKAGGLKVHQDFLRHHCLNVFLALRSHHRKMAYIKFVFPFVKPLYIYINIFDRRNQSGRLIICIYIYRSGWAQQMLVLKQLFAKTVQYFCARMSMIRRQTLVHRC